MVHIGDMQRVPEPTPLLKIDPRCLPEPGALREVAKELFPEEFEPAQSPKTRALTIGIDPGLSGAIAFMGDHDTAAFDLPVIRDNKLAWIDGAELQAMIINARGGRQATAMVERVNSMPQQGVASSFQFGVGFGSILSILQALSIPIEFVRPAVWKKALNLGADKKAALHKARLLYPDVDLRLAKHDGRAEALLIARYARSAAK